jgi:Spy/CpxP family protein refolding chaperone
MKVLIRSLLASTLGLWTALSGIAASADSPCSAPSVAEPTEEAPPSAPHRHHGLFHAIGELIGQLDLSPEQRTAVEALGKKVVPPLLEAHRAKHAVVLALTDQLESGRTDPAALEPQIAAYVEASAKASPALHAAIDELHKILTPEQRQKLADGIKERMEKHHEHHSAAARLDRLTKDLGLTDDQKEQFRSSFQKYEPVVKEHHELFARVLEAFKGDSFSFDQLVPGFDPAAHARAVAQMMIEMTDATAKILTPDQRAILAQKIRTKLSHHEHEHTGTIQQSAPSSSTAPETTSSESVGTSQDPLWAGTPWLGLGFPGYGQFGWSSFGYPGLMFGYPAFGGFGTFPMW